MCRWVFFAAVFGVLFASSVGSAITVPAGFDLFTTSPGTYFDSDGPSGPFPPIPFLGVPLTTYDFGGGPLAVGSTDTIVERQAPASGPGIDTIPIEMVSLQLVSAVPIPLGSLGGTGTDFIGVTLSSDRGRHGSDPADGAASTGSMSIDFGTRTFGSSITLFFDLREGGVTGPILPLGMDGTDTISNTAITWAPAASEFLRLVPVPEETDLPQPLDPFTFHLFTTTADPEGSNSPLLLPGINGGFIVGVAFVPEPSTATLMGLLCLGCVARRSRRRAPRMRRVTTAATV